jgi:hypothetical protein
MDVRLTNTKSLTLSRKQDVLGLANRVGSLAVALDGSLALGLLANGSLSLAFSLVRDVTRGHALIPGLSLVHGHPCISHQKRGVQNIILVGQRIACLS